MGGIFKYKSRFVVSACGIESEDEHGERKEY